MTASGYTPAAGAVFALAGGPGTVHVPGGASVAGARADAWLRVHDAEHMRRRGSSYADLPLLDVLGRLPLGVAVPLGGLASRDLEVVLSAPRLAVKLQDGHATRLLRRPVRVALVTCRGTSWRAALQRAASFRHFAPAAVLLDRLPPRWREIVWEADVAGVGVLIGAGREPEEVLPPVVPVGLRKAAHWRFEERAYRSWFLTG